MAWTGELAQVPRLYIRSEINLEWNLLWLCFASNRPWSWCIDTQLMTQCEEWNFLRGDEDFFGSGLRQEKYMNPFLLKFAPKWTWRGNWKREDSSGWCVCVCGDLVQERVGLREGRRGRRSGEERGATWNPRRSQLGKQNARARGE